MTDSDDLLTHAAQEFADHATETMAEAVRLRKMLAEAHRTGRPVWGWSDHRVDPADVFEAARALRTYCPPSGDGTSDSDKGAL